MKTVQAIKRLPIRTYLAERGLLPTKDNPRYDLYLSPLRKEHTPSFKVDYVQNLWYDFELCAGGSIIDLVMRLERCDFAQAVRFLGSGERPPMAVLAPLSVLPTVPALRILSDIPLRHPALSGYLSSLGIDHAIASACCWEVHYAVGRRNYFDVGFRNDTGRFGTALRTLQKQYIAQAHYDNRQMFRYCCRIRGLYGFLILPLNGKAIANRCRSSELGRQSAESGSVSRPAYDDSCVFR